MVGNFNFNDISVNIELIKILFIELFTYYTFIRIINKKIVYNNKVLLEALLIDAVDIIVTYIKFKIDFFISRICLIILLSFMFSKWSEYNFGYAIITTIIALAFNYIVLFISIIINFAINILHNIQSDYINLCIILIVHYVLLYGISRIKRIKNGISFLKRKSSNNLFDIIILNISTIILFSFITIVCTEGNSYITRNLFIGFIIFAIMMFITIQKSIQAYYKQKLLIQDLTETKKELEEKKKEVEDLEKENLKFSMRSHSIAHKQKSLEYKLNKILQSTETAEEIELKNRMENIAKEAYVAPFAIALAKTEIEPIDDMLEYMQAECAKDNIEFNLQINGNIHKMVNNYVEMRDLEILLADHIKDAIIAINHTDNINRSILVKLGEFDNCYSLNIYDSGVNFPKEILENLGKKPITSYPNEGGTGMGYMTTFETLRKYKASLIIEEFGMPSKENFTKVVSIIFDKKNEFKIL